ncbi:hypothetical protein ACJIZ3_012287 [Penstemon smallii]|uniref:Cytochrome P450 n=1 Tax=Penstemon smallii TaxID=265156 RepID=A0ABD3UQ52_9LAMI
MDEYYQFFVGLFTTLLIILLYLYLKSFPMMKWPLYDSKNTISKIININVPPSPPKLPILGHLHYLGYLPHRSLWDLSKKHGPLMLLQLGSRPMLVVSSAEVAKEVLKIHDVSFADRPELGTVKRAFYHPKDVIISPYGEQWRRSRSIIVHQLLNTKKVKSFNSIIEEETSLLVEKLVSSCSSSAAVNLTNMLESLGIDIIYRSTFGKKMREIEQGKKVADMINEGVSMLVNFSIGEFIPWLGWINKFNGFDAAMKRVLKTRNEILDTFIQEYLAVAEAEAEAEAEFLIDTLVGIYRGATPGVSIDLESVKALILNVLVAGAETASTTLEWAMTELIRHPSIYKKLQDEIKQVLKGKKDINENDLEKMHYMKAVIKETLRYHPPIAMNLRECREDVNLMGYNIATKTGVIINMWAIGRDPAYWDEPHVFLPERFLDSSIDFKGFDFQFIPFGAGRRICPGISYANGVIELVLANLVHKFNWALPDGAKGESLDVIEQPGITNGRKYPLILIATNS